MGEIFIWEEENGSISVGIPVPGRGLRLIEQYEKTEAGKNARRLPDRDASELPDREFRDAWRANSDGTIRVDTQIKQQIMQERVKPTIEERLAVLEAKENA